MQMRVVARTILVVLALCPAVAVAAPDTSKTLAQLQKALVAFQAGDCARSVKLARPLIPARIAALSEQQQATVYDWMLMCQLRLGKTDDAYMLASAATRLLQASDYAWMMRFGLESDSARNNAALATIEEMAQARGTALNAIPLQWVFQFSHRFEGKDKAVERTRLLKILADPAYQPSEPLASTEWFRLRYAVILIEKGETETARTLLSTIANADTLTDMLFDARLRAVVPTGIDLRRATEAELVRIRRLRTANPRVLEAVIHTAYTLRRLGRVQESLDTLKTVEAKMADGTAFDDFGEQREWWWDAMGRSYTALGNYDAAVASFGNGAALNEGGRLNVSQTINLAEMQNNFGKYDAALATLAAFDNPERKGSPYGESEMRFARGCATAKLGRTAQAEADLAYLIAHEADHPDALFDVLLCRGEWDAAAAAAIRRLDDPDRRAGALRQLSDYDAPAVPRQPDFMTTGIAQVKTRPDVAVAIARAGGTRRIPLQKSEL